MLNQTKIWTKQPSYYLETSFAIVVLGNFSSNTLLACKFFCHTIYNQLKVVTDIHEVNFYINVTIIVSTYSQGMITLLFAF